MSEISARLREMTKDAAWYSEPRRAFCNALAALIIPTHVVVAWPGVRGARTVWRRVLLVAGVSFAAALARFFSSRMLGSHGA
jgi:L-lactate permease